MTNQKPPHNQQPNAPEFLTSSAEEPAGLSNKISSWLGKLGMQLGKREDDLHEALAELIEDQPEGGTGAALPEYQLLNNILQLKERTVADCMCPRADIIAVEAEMDFVALVQFVNKEAHSRYPVYRTTLDDCIGMVHMKDIMAQLVAGQKPKIESMLRQVMFIPTTMPIMKLLLQMRQQRQHMAIVVDEYGGVDGLITIEDLVEQIVGEIEDEHDESDYPAPRLQPDGSMIVDGRMPLKALEEKLGDFMNDALRDEIETVNGLVLMLAGQVPARGTHWVQHSQNSHQHLVLEVLEADTRRVRRARVKLLPATAENIVSLAAGKN